VERRREARREGEEKWYLRPTVATVSAEEHHLRRGGLYKRRHEGRWAQGPTSPKHHENVRTRQRDGEKEVMKEEGTKGGKEVMKEGEREGRGNEGMRE